MACRIKIDTDKAKALKGLEDYCGSNCTQFYTYLTTVIKSLNNNTGELEFTDGFKVFFGEDKLDINETDANLLKDKIIAYFNSKYPSVYQDERHTSGFDKVKKYGYQSISDREFGKRLFANKILQLYRNVKARGEDVNKKPLKWFIDRAKDSYTRTLAKRLSDIIGIDTKTLTVELLKSDNISYLNNVIKGHENELNYQLKNLIALYTEYSTGRLDNVNDINPSRDFIEEVVFDSRLTALHLNSKLNEEEKQRNDEAEEEKLNNAETTEDEIDDADFDTYIYNLNNKLGIRTNFMLALGDDVKTILSSLRLMNSDTKVEGNFVQDTDNGFGIADVMDADMAASILYHYGEYGNPTQMMESILRISKNLEGCACFRELYDLLKDDLNLKLKFFATFHKSLMGRVETVVRDGKSETHLVNRGINKTSIFEFELFNAAKSSSLTVSPITINAIVLTVNTKLKTYNQLTDTNNEKIREIALDIANGLRKFYPSINEMDIRNFIIYNEDNGVVNKKENAKLLIEKLNEANSLAQQTAKNYEARKSELAVAKHHNYVVNGKRIKGIENAGEIVDLNPIFAKGYISDGFVSHTKALAKLLTPYHMISTPLNSRNVHGNQQSDPINDSMMTFIKNMLESSFNTRTKVEGEDGSVSVTWNDNSPIIRFANQRFLSKQYDFSPILLEHKDEKGNIINYGLFREETVNGVKRYVPVENFNELLKIQLFDGASNIDDGSNASWTDLSRNDYIGTAWRQFFDSQKNNTTNYFMRIPSDAPKNFVITAPKYDIKGLLQVSNEKEAKQQIKEILDKAEETKVTSFTGIRFINNPIVVSKHSKTLNLGSFTEHVMTNENGTVNITIPQRYRKNINAPKDKPVQIALRYRNEDTDSDTSNVYIMEGMYVDGVLKNATFKGFADGNINKIINGISTNVPFQINSVIWSDLSSKMYDNRDKLTKDNPLALIHKVDRNHPLFKQFVNAFKQELTDMAVAANVLFETNVNSDGSLTIKTKLDKTVSIPVLNKKGGIINSNTDHNGLNPIYHFEDKKEDGKGEIYHVDKNTKTVKLTGKVFTSDRFQFFDHIAKTDENFGTQILNEAFDLFGNEKETDNDRIFRFTSEGDVILSDTQIEVINKKIEEFILEYVEQAKYRLDGALFLDEETPSTNKIAEFMLNTHLAYIGFNDLFEGDTKFYKDNKTFLKRAKESQGSGVAYGVMDITRPWTPSHSLVETVLDNTNFTFISAEGKTSPFKVQMYDSFKAITIFNTIRTNKAMLEELVSALTNKNHMGDAVLTETQARNLLFGEDGKGGYQNITINDAQSYITFEEWIRRVTARGKFDEYKPIIDKILNESTPLTTEDITAFVQVQKNFYYDQYYNPNTKTIAGRQIKNAEFVLVPRLVQGTELEKVAKLMHKLGIDQLNTAETSKAAQSYKFTLWDNDGHISQDILDDIDGVNKKPKSDIMKNGKNGIELFSYNFLYTQQETPQHIDSENKAGIQVVKKLLDNIDENSPKELKEAKETFTTMYVANIQSSFINVCNRFNIQIDNDGNILTDNHGNILVETRDKDGNVITEGIQYQKFFDALKEECARLGLTSNMIDYCTIDKRSPYSAGSVMPNYMSLVSSKFENIVQSIFNNGITRQTLPGFHAAQVSGMGLRPLNTQVDRKMTSNVLRYHPIVNGEQKHYCEVMLPASNFGFDRNSDRAKLIWESAYNKSEGNTEADRRIIADKAVDDYFLKQLQNAGCDEIIGYRIPTEGKQSVAVFKVVGFTPDAYGSTIMVPDDWVSQTGSDFDIDSIYGIQYSTYFDKDGNLKRVEYITDKRKLYNKYVFRNLSEEEINKAFDDSRLADIYVQDLRKKYKTKTEFNREGFLAELKETSAKQLELVLEEIAEEKGLKSFDEFSQQSVELLNSKEARNNQILDAMKTMLIHPSSIEENLSRSNFDSIKESLNKCIVGSSAIERKSRSPYNFLDQADYQEDTMSGAKLKGFSVTRDTLCSICNATHSELNNNSEILVEYEGDYNVDELINRFGKENVIISSTGGLVLRHTRFGWSNDNKNIDGKLITAYSSQTTAHILDAVKTGNVPNVTELTFQVYKTLFDVGSNSDTAVSFIMQPAIRRIITAYNKTNSIYTPEKNRNYIFSVIRDIADELNIEYTKDQKIDDILAEINFTYGDKIMEMFGVPLELNDETIKEIPLSFTKQLARLKAENEIDSNRPVEENINNLLYDLQIVLQYAKINNLATDVRNATMVLNPDKFGAKQTMYATREVFDNIVAYVNDNIIEDAKGNIEQRFRLTVDGKNIISSIYPNVENYDNADEYLEYILSSSDFINNSKYKPLAAFLKFATATSIKVNKTLFLTQGSEFINFIKSPDYGLASVLSNGRKVNEKVAKDFQNYIINNVVIQSDFLNAPLKYNLGKGENRGFEYIGKNTRRYNEVEAKRVFGYEHSPAIAISETLYVDKDGNVVNPNETNVEYKTITNTRLIKFEDLNNPTQEELDLFIQLSPAQKVQFVKEHFSGDNLFKYIDVQLYNERSTRGRRAGTQTMQFNENAANIETIYADFKRVFSSKNPIIACTAADIIKYAFYVEGYKMGMGNVSKMIPNDVLLNGGRIYGTNIVRDSNQVMYNFDNFIDENSESIIENYIRSHSSTAGINIATVRRTDRGEFELTRRDNGLIQINISNDVGVDLAVKFGILYNTPNSKKWKVNKYVRLTFAGKTTLYKIVDRWVNNNNRNVFLYPLNYLEENENTEWSAIAANNIHPNQEYYIDIINAYIDNATRNNKKLEGFDSEAFKEAVNKIKADIENYTTKYGFKETKAFKTQALPVPDINKNPSLAKVKDEINKWQKESIPTDTHYIWNSTLSNYISDFDADNGTVQKIQLSNGNIKTIRVYKKRIDKFIDDYTGKNIDREIASSDKRDKELIELIRDVAKQNSEFYVPKYFGDIYAIEETNTSIVDNESIDSLGDDNFSTILDVAVQAASSMHILAKQGNEESKRITQFWRDKGIKTNKEELSKDSVNQDDVIVYTAKYLKNAANNLEQRLNHYMQLEENGEYLPIDDDRVIAAVKKDASLRRNYIKTLLEPKALVDRFGVIKELDVDSEDPDMQIYLNEIKEAVTKIQNNSRVNRAIDKFAREYYDRESENPIIKNHFVSVLDGYWRSSWLNVMFNDAQEASNPIVQLALKHFNSDVNAKTIVARRRAAEFAKQIKEFEREAKAKGLSFDLNSFIDADGRIKQPYNEKFIEDRNEHQRNVANAAKTYGENSVEHLKAKLDYDKWKVKHVEQPVVKEYYEERIALIDNMFKFSKWAEWYSRYEKLRAEYRRLNNLVVPGVDNLDLNKQIDDIKDKMWYMRNLKYTENSESNPYTQASVKLNETVDGLRALETKYFKYDAIYNFEETVEKYKKVVDSYEKSGKPESTYINNPEYIKAKTWLRQNVIIKPNWTDEISAKVSEAYRTLYSHTETMKGRNIINSKKYQNKFGEFDPTLIPEEELKRLKAEQLARWGYVDEVFGDKTIISNRGKDNNIYKSEFYRSMVDNNERKVEPREWLETVKEINDILGKYYNEATGEIDLQDIPNNAEGVAELKKLRQLYDRLSEIRGKSRTKKSKETAKFIKDNVEVGAYNESKFNSDEEWINKVLERGKYQEALRDLIYDIDDSTNKRIPNNYLYGILKPKKEVEDKFTDKEKTDALKIINTYKETKIRPDYFVARRNAQRTLSKEEYNKWFKLNHVYNPYKGKFEPLSIWMYTISKADSYTYEPTMSQTVRNIRDGHMTLKEARMNIENEPDETKTPADLAAEYNPNIDYRNKNYNENGGHAANYIKGSDSKYDSDITANEVELKAAKYIQDVLLSLANTQDSEKYIKQGKLPARAKHDSGSVAVAKEFAKLFGWDYQMRDGGDNFYHDISYTADRPQPMPMLEQLKGKGYVDPNSLPKPERKEGETDEQYAIREKEYNDKKEEITKKNAELHRALLDRDWVNVISDFIVRASTYNAIQDNKYELFYAQELLKRHGSYINSRGRLKRNIGNSTSENTEYLRTQDKQLIEQFENQIRRLVYNQYKNDTNPKLLRFMSLVQSVTSAQYMMFNYKGGIANITLGESQIQGEMWAREFLGIKEYGKGKSFYVGGTADYMAHAYTNRDAAATLQGAIINFFDIVDYDEHTGVSRISKDAVDVLRRIRDFGYHPQTSGEHMMQNSVLFGMLMSHRLYENPKANELGQPKYIYKNFAEATRDLHEQALLDILSDEQKQEYENYKERVSAKADDFKEFAWYRKDVTTEFARIYLDKKQKVAFYKKREVLTKDVEKEFNDNTKHPTLLSQLRRGNDGKLEIIVSDDSTGLLGTIDIPKENGEPSDAIKLLADFKGRVISVNKYIHGVYDKSGRAKIENTWFGSLFMQYHKHLPIGLRKRYGYEGFYNEERGQVNKGMYTSLIDFISIPFDNVKERMRLDNEELLSLKGLQGVFKELLDFAVNIGLNYELLPDYDRANLRRMLGDATGLLLAVFMTIAIKAGADDDDKEGLLYNLAIYEADRLATEAGQYFPPVAYNEFRKLWQSPIAAGSGLTDILTSANLICHMIIEGDDFDGEYHTGRFAGQNKLAVRIKRRIPIWRGISSSFIDIKDSNQYYKIGDNVLNFVNPLVQYGN